MGSTKRNYGAKLLRLRPTYRQRLLDIESERTASGLDDEQFAASCLQKARLKIVFGPKKSNVNDDGIDFILSLNDRLLFIQLKWWKSSLGNKSIKRIFGEMYLSDEAMSLREDGKNISYFLLVPFIGTNAWVKSDRFAQHDFHLVWGENFVRFMTNPHYYLNHRLEV